MKQFAFILSFCGLAFSACLEAKKQAPNIILVIAEDLGRDWIGCYEGAGKTPSIDRLAKNGFRFEIAWNMIDAQASEATALTGSYNPNPNRPTIASALKKNGYTTAIVSSNANTPSFSSDFDRRSPDPIEELKKITQGGSSKPVFLFYSIGPEKKIDSLSQLRNYTSEVDKAVGMIQDAVEKSPKSENTTIIFASGSGSPFSGRLANSDFPASKRLNSDIGARAAFIVSGPFANANGRVSKDLIDFSDLYPTILELASARLPINALIDGKSFVPSLEDSDDPFDKRSWIFARTGDFHMIRDWHHLVDSAGAFHDLGKDPLQQEKVSPLDKQAPHRQERLQMVLDRLAGHPTRSLAERIQAHEQAQAGNQ